MKVISNAEFGGERPLFESHDLRLENVICLLYTSDAADE